MEARRCNIHGLVAADDGRCVICRRGDLAPDDPSLPQPISPTTIVIGVGGFVLCAVLLYWITHPPPQRPPLVEPPARIVEREPVAPTPPPPRPPPPPTPQPSPVMLSDQGSQVVNPDGTVSEDPKLTAAKRRVPIKLYSTPACSYCPISRRWLTQNGYRFTEYDIDQSETDKVEMQSLNPAMTVPTFDVGGLPVIGFDPRTLDAAITRMATPRRR